MKNTEFAYSNFQTITGNFNGLKDKTLWAVSADSSDGQGTYSFIAFIEEYANLEEGEVAASDATTSFEDDDMDEFDDVIEDETEGVVEETSDFPWLVVVLAVVVLGGGAVATVLILKKKKAKTSADLNS